jgi:hypothetical protein
MKSKDRADKTSKDKPLSGAPFGANFMNHAPRLKPCFRWAFLVH